MALHRMAKSVHSCEAENSTAALFDLERHVTKSCNCKVLIVDRMQFGL